MKAVVAMSGGVDSTMAAALLKDEGVDVVGLHLLLWGSDSDVDHPASPPADLRRIADLLDIELVVVDLRDGFDKAIVQPFVDEYARGRTPNPCIRCNQTIKFRTLADVAHQHDARWIASGHYARVVHRRGHWQLLKGTDVGKDQSYFLFRLDSQLLPIIRLPLGELTKHEVRELARRRGIASLTRPESQEICFVSDGRCADFIRQRKPQVDRPGPIVDMNGRVLGQHRGLYRYTVGQRRGLGLPGPDPHYVVRLDADRHALVVGTPRDACSTRLQASGCVWPSGIEPQVGDVLSAKVRYRSQPTPARIESVGGDVLKLRFVEPVQAAAPGQAVVLYDGEWVVGGGWIDST